MKNYESVLLDWDGNIAKTLDIWLAAYDEVLKSHGHNVSYEEIGANFTRFTAFAAGLGISEPEGAMTEADRLASQLLPTIELYPDALEVLEDMSSKNKSMALITSSGRRHVEGALNKYNLSQYFQAIVTGDDVTRLKPDAEPLLTALGRLGTNKEYAVMIGDSASDLEAANNARIDSILFYPPEHSKFYSYEELESYNPTHIVTDFRDIKQIM